MRAHTADLIASPRCHAPSPGIKPIVPDAKRGEPGGSPLPRGGSVGFPRVVSGKCGGDAALGDVAGVDVGVAVEAVEVADDAEAMLLRHVDGPKTE